MSVVDTCLFEKDKEKFIKVEKEAIYFCDQYMREIVPRDSFINFLTNYVQNKDSSLHYFSFPMNDDNLFAFSFYKKGRFFICINNKLPVCKQNFALAHEAYHIYCFLEEKEESVLCTTVDKNAYDNMVDMEELKANAFAGMVMIPRTELEKQISLFKMDADFHYSVEEICTLMDYFGMPFKSVVLRLFECEKITKDQANDLLEKNDQAKEYINMTGIGRRWQLNSIGQNRFGDLQTKFKMIKDHEWMTEEREQEEMAFIQKMINLK